MLNPTKMTREQALALYQPIADAVSKILTEAAALCSEADTRRAGKQLGLWTKDGLALADEEIAMDMVGDIALFEPNRRGRRVYDVFLEKHASKLGAFEHDIAQKIGQAFFSLFRSRGQHPAGGITALDLRARDRRLWLMDPRLGDQDTRKQMFGLRMFNAGPFCVGVSSPIFPPKFLADEYVFDIQYNMVRKPALSFAAMLCADVLLPYTPRAVRFLDEFMSRNTGDEDSSVDFPDDDGDDSFEP